MVLFARRRERNAASSAALDEPMGAVFLPVRFKLTKAHASTTTDHTLCLDIL
jgi:hypothetical protein